MKIVFLHSCCRWLLLCLPAMMYADATGALAPEHYPAAVILQNPSVRCVVVPEGGRLIAFETCTQPVFDPIFRRHVPTAETRRKGLREFVSAGGSRLWPHACGAFAKPLIGREYPPDETFDHSGWRIIHHTERTLTLASRTAERIGIRAERTFRLDSGKARIAIEERVIRTRLTPVPPLLWTITEIHLPEVLVMQEGKQGAFFPWENAVCRKQNGLCAIYPQQKIFHVVDGGAFACAAYRDWLLIQRHAPSLQAIVYGDPAAGYAEIESKSRRFTDLKVGEAATSTVILELRRRPAVPVEKMAPFLNYD